MSGRVEIGTVGRAAVRFTWRRPFLNPRPDDGQGATVTFARDNTAEQTKAVKRQPMGVKKASTTGPPPATGSSFVVVLDAEGPAEAASE